MTRWISLVSHSVNRSPAFTLATPTKCIKSRMISSRSERRDDLAYNIRDYQKSAEAPLKSYNPLKHTAVAIRYNMESISLLIRASLSLFKIYKKLKSGQIESLNDRNMILFMNRLAIDWTNVHKLVLPTIFPFILFPLSLFFPNAVHPIYRRLGYHALNVGYGRMLVKKAKLSSAVLGIHKKLIERATKNTNVASSPDIFTSDNITLKKDAPIHYISATITRYASLTDLSYLQSVKVAKFLNISTPFLFPKAKIYSWADWVLKGNVLLSPSTVRSLDLNDLVDELILRGYKIDVNNAPEREQLVELLLEHIRFVESSFPFVEATYMKDNDLKGAENYTSIMERPSPLTPYMASLLVIHSASHSSKYL